MEAALTGQASRGTGATVSGIAYFGARGPADRPGAFHTLLGKLIPMQRLIVNADDFGLTDGINRAVADLNDAGALRSATLMAEAPRFEDAVRIAQQRPALGVGCHIVLVDGVPAADPASIPSLLGPSRSRTDPPEFRTTLGAFVRELSLGRIAREDIEREASAQILRLQGAGIAVTHVDTHKHTHIFPVVLDGVTRAAKACGVRAIRNPFEPGWSTAGTPNAGLIRKLQLRLLGRHRQNFWRVIQQREFATTDGCLGVLATGTLDEATLRSAFQSMPDGVWELVCHPGHFDEELRATRTRLQESRATELAALRMLPGLLADSSSRQSDANGHATAQEKRNPVEQIHFGQL